MKVRKPVRLAFWAAVLLLSLFVLALGHDFPNFTKQGALHRAEGRQLLEKSRLTAALPLDTSHFEKLEVDPAVILIGETDSHVHLVKAAKEGLVWNSRHGVSYPKEDRMLALLPFTYYGTYYAKRSDGVSALPYMAYCGFFYSKEPYHHGEARLYWEGRTLAVSAVFTPDDSGYAVFVLSESYNTSKTKLELDTRMALYGINKDITFTMVRVGLEVVLYDAREQEIGRYRWEKPGVSEP